MTKSLYHNRLGIALMACSALFVATGQLFWKLGTDQGLVYFAIGFVIYGVGAALLIVSFRYGDVSVLHPFLSLNYIFAFYLGYFVLAERISLTRVLGVIVIILGVILIGGTKHE